MNTSNNHSNRQSHHFVVQQQHQQQPQTSTSYYRRLSQAMTGSFRLSIKIKPAIRAHGSTTTNSTSTTTTTTTTTSSRRSMAHKSNSSNNQTAAALIEQFTALLDEADAESSQHCTTLVSGRRSLPGGFFPPLFSPHAASTSSTSSTISSDDEPPIISTSSFQPPRPPTPKRLKPINQYLQPVPPPPADNLSSYYDGQPVKLRQQHPTSAPQRQEQPSVDNKKYFGCCFQRASVYDPTNLPTLPEVSRSTLTEMATSAFRAIFPSTSSSMASLDNTSSDDCSIEPSTSFVTLRRRPGANQTWKAVPKAQPPQTQPKIETHPNKRHSICQAVPSFFKNAEIDFGSFESASSAMMAASGGSSTSRRKSLLATFNAFGFGAGSNFTAS